MNRTVPKLRFPEFRGSEEWEEKKLGSLSKILRGGSPRPIDDFITLDINGLNWLKIGDIDKDSKYIIHTQERVRVEALSKTRVVNPGDLILSNSMSFGRPYILKIQSCIHDGWIAVTEIKKSVNTDYLYYLILSPTSQVYFFNHAAGGGVKNLNADIIELLPSPIPSDKKEQQKIADCLTSIDDLITEQIQKLDALKAYKKGLMQKLFPAEGENVPKLRFPEFREPWKIQVMGKIYTFISSNTFSRENLNYELGLVKNIHYGDIHIKFATLFDITKEKVPYINSDIDLTNVKASSFCIEGDVVFADASEDLKDVGKSIELIKLNNEKILSGLHTILARQIGSEIQIGFAGYLFKCNKVRTQIQKEAQGIKVLSISTGRLSDIEICFPPNKVEQQKIFDCLSFLDALITAQSQKIDTLKLQKKGLMQQLFPSAYEVNG